MSKDPNTMCKQCGNRAKRCVLLSCSHWICRDCITLQMVDKLGMSKLEEASPDIHCPECKGYARAKTIHRQSCSCILQVHEEQHAIRPEVEGLIYKHWRRLLAEVCAQHRIFAARNVRDMGRKGDRCGFAEREDRRRSCPPLLLSDD